MKYQVLTQAHFQQVKQLIIKEFSTNSIIENTFQIPYHQIYYYRLQNLVFKQNTAIVAINQNKVVGVAFSQDFLDFAHDVLNTKINYSKVLQFIRENMLKVVVLDFLKRHPNIKRGQVVYNKSGCVDQKYSNKRIITKIGNILTKFNIERGYKYMVGFTSDQKVLKLFHYSKITSFSLQNKIFNGKVLALKFYLIQTHLTNELKSKL